MSDASIRTEKKEVSSSGQAIREYSMGLVSPMLTYRIGIDTLQEITRRLRKADAHNNDSIDTLHL